MRLLFLTHAFNGLAQRLYVELAARGHEVAVELDVNDAVTAEAVALARPQAIVAPFLKRAIPAAVWSRIPCLVVHPGIPGDRGPSALDWAIQEGVEAWGVTVLEARAGMDAGPVWAHAGFPMREATKSSLYRREVTEAAVGCVLEALERMQAGERPVPAERLEAGAKGRARPFMRQADRAIDWARDDTSAILRRIHAADGVPGVLDAIAGATAYLHGAHREPGFPGGRPGELVARKQGAVLRATRDGALWITHLRRAPEGAPTFKLPATEVLGEAARNLPEWSDGDGAWREIRYEERGAVGVLRFAFHNGAMSAAQCDRLRAAFEQARARPTRVIVLAGGEDFWSNGIHLNAIEACDTPADASWRNINAIDDLAREILTTTSHLTVSAVGGNAGAGGVFLALGADRVWLRRGVVLNPHYRGMGNLYGSEYWTYVLPRRLGGEAAAQVAARRLPMGCEEALRLRLADAVLEGQGEAFLDRAVAEADALAQRDDFADLLAAKAAARRRDEAAKPLARYREEELERMKLNFYGFDPSYHVARYHFVHKLPKARTPSYLAPHRRSRAA